MLLNFPRFLFPATTLGLLVSLSGCASVSVGNIFPKGTPPKKLPERIYVEEFTAPQESFHVDRSNHDLEAFVKAERLALAENLKAQLSKYTAPTEILPEGNTPPKGNFWLVKGIYDRVNQGSRALRIAVGFGAGGTKFETRVQVCSLSTGRPEPFLSVANAGGASLGGLSVDRARTAREITAALSEFCFEKSLITERRTRRPKKLGLLPAFQRPDFVIPKKGL